MDQLTYFYGGMKISIFGCGWLGKQLASSLLEEGYSVVASYRNPVDRIAIEKLGLSLFHLPDLKDLKNIPQELLDGIDAAIITFPPPRTEIAEYLNGFSMLMKSLSNVNQIIYTSSIGVYPNKSGNYSETYTFSEIEKQDVRMKVEELIRSFTGNRSVILRLGGLIGPDRHPLNSISGKSLNGDGNTSVNLIDSRDVVSLIKKLLALNDYPNLLNVSYPSDMKKSDYYNALALKWGVDPPLFGLDPDPDRRINSEPFVRLMGINSLRHPFNEALRL